jgi:hypothetical protein
MKPLNNRDFLRLWEQGCSMHPLDQGLLALGAALPDAAQGMPADWPLGRRNKALIELRCACFGPRLQAWFACSQCAEKMQCELDGAALAQEPEGHSWRSEPVIVNGRQFRLPTSRDLARVARESDADAAALRLAEVCRISVTEPQPEAAAPLDLDEVGRQMSLADPLAEILIDLTCPACGYNNNSYLDIASYLWAEIEARAKRLLHEVHALASAYGWTEHEVLSLSDQRRAVYVEMVRA